MYTFAHIQRNFSKTNSLGNLSQMKNMHVLIVCETSLAVKSARPVLSKMKKITALCLYKLLEKWLPRDFFVTKKFTPHDFWDKNM